MPRKANALQRPEKHKQRSPIPVRQAVTVEPVPLDAVMPLSDEWALELMPEPKYEAPLAPAPTELPPMKGPLPLDAVNRKGPVSEASIKLETGLQMLERMVSDPLYLKNVEERMRQGKLAPPIEAFIWQRVYGRPMEAGKLGDGDVPDVKIIHEFTNIIESGPKDG